MNKYISMGVGIALSIAFMVAWHYYDIASWEDKATVTLDDGTVYSGLLSWTSMSRDWYQIATENGVYLFPSNKARIIEIHHDSFNNQ